MEGILKQMQATVMKYARVLSQVLQVDVEIVDDRLVRIAGTGMFANRINSDMASEGHVYQAVIRSGEKKVIENPGYDQLCNNCPKLNHCEELFEISSPIKVGRKVIGVIGFVCFHEQQKNHIMKNFNTFMEFMDQIADLISSKAKEEIENEKKMNFLKLLNSIIDNISQGVMIIDEADRVIKINETGADILKLDHDDLIKSMELNNTGDTFFGQKEYELGLNGRSYRLLGEVQEINLDNGRDYRIFIFNDTNSFKEKIFSVTSTSEDIGLGKIVGVSPAIVTLKKKVCKIAPSSSTVLITGESGTGKELFARAIHDESRRHKRPFVAINCAAIPDTLQESELFGYEKGAFTGADPRGKIGKIELAHQGTLFLDEIGDIPLYLQAKLLRVLEQRTITRLGSNRQITVDIRIIAATNKKLEKMIAEKTFREDLYYRLNVIPLDIPPLRERVEDIKVLTEHFIKKYSLLLNKKVYGIEDLVWDYLYHYRWPGNVRELQNVIEYMINMLEGEGIITASLLPRKLAQQTEKGDPPLTMSGAEQEMIRRALLQYGNSVKGKQEAARALGIGIATLYRKIKRYGLS